MKPGVVWQAGIVLAVCIGTGRAGTVSSLDQIPAQLQTEEAKSFWRQQMAGQPAPDGLGVHLPAALTAKTVTDLLVPRDDRQPRNLVGAKPWPGRADSYMAIVCTGGAPSTADEPRCAQPDYDESGPPWHVYLGVIEAKGGAAPRLIARSGAVDGALGWDDSGLPARPMTAEDAWGHEIRPQSFERFDLAHYEIAPGEQAFGLRGAWQESYSGGGAYYTALYLFAIVGGRLRQVLAAPMSAFQNIAGEWHEDGTRSHTIIDSDNVLIVSAQRTAGHFDLIVKNRTGPWQRRLRWSAAAGMYRAGGG
jgi:hypothetical protein